MESIKARVTRSGAILLGSNFTVDGHSSRPVRIVTHIHADHILELEKSIRECTLVAGTSYTLEILDILGYKIPMDKMLSLDYWKPIEILGEALTLVPARHIVGSSQVLVETRDYRVGYTSDFKMPGTPPLMDLDILVIDATYGSPHLQRKWADWEAMAALINIVEESLKKGSVVIYAYHGKIQEIMMELRIRGIKESFIVDLQGLKIARVAEKFYNVKLDPIMTSSDEYTNSIIFRHASEYNESKSKLTKILVTGWELRAPAIEVKDNIYRVSFSDHATFKEIIDYVREAKPKQVIVDGTRGTATKITAKYVEKILGIPAMSQPS
ncbi:MAG: MBL fold metallo-hydrolase [Acidilobaceae archaeon]